VGKPELYIRPITVLVLLTGHKVYQELLPGSGTLREDIEALKKLGLLEAAKSESITVRFPVWEIMIFGISVWEKCNERGLQRAPSDIDDSDLKLQTARKAIHYICSLATKERATRNGG